MNKHTENPAGILPAATIARCCSRARDTREPTEARREQRRQPSGGTMLARKESR